LQQSLERIRAAQQRKVAEQARKDKIAALKAAALAESNLVESPIADAPVGMVDGQGDEVGVSVVSFVREFIRLQWGLSKYQPATGAPEAEVKFFYNRDGTLLHYRFLHKSGDNAFDDSLIRAIVKSKQLPRSLPKAMEFDVTFNLKDMLDR